MKTLNLLILTLLLTISVNAQPWIGPTAGNIYYQGNVGIGTTSPYNALEVHKASSATYNGTPQFRVSSVTAGNRAEMIFSDNLTSNALISFLPAGVATTQRLSISASYPNVESDFVLLGNGNVGIGTTSPTQKLSIAGTSVSGIASQINISAFTNNAMRINGSVADVSQDAITYQSGGGGGGAAIAFGRGGSYDTFMSFYTNPTAISGSIAEQMRITSTGKVGIGTTSPGEKLQVEGTTSDTKIMVVSPLGGSLFTSGIEFRRTTVSGGSKIETLRDAIVGGVGLNFFTTVDNAAEIARTYVPRMSILNTGYVGIGTTNPTYKLDVIGTIRAREIKVDLNGADFVFEKEYKLMPINELEAFVKEQKHLPEVAPAKEMQENGTDLGNLNSKLLQKVEELTLYLIDQNKQISQLKEENITIRKLIAK